MLRAHLAAARTSCGSAHILRQHVTCHSFPPLPICLIACSLARPRQRLCTNGPHHFGLAGLELDGTPLSAEHSLALPHSVAVLLHYESCTYAGWRTKFVQMAREDQGKGKRFSPYYHESIKAAAAINAVADERAVEAREEARNEEARNEEAREEQTGQPDHHHHHHQQQQAPNELGLAAQVPAESPGNADERRRSAEQCARSVWSMWRVEPPRLPKGPVRAPETCAGEAAPPAAVHQCIRRLGVTLIDPPPAAAAAAKVRATRKVRKSADEGVSALASVT